MLIEVTTELGSAQAALTVGPAAPGIFVMGSANGQGAILTSTGELAATSGSVPGLTAGPARRGEFVSIYATGLGDVTNRPASGAAASKSPLSDTFVKPIVRIGGVSATPTFSGLAPNFAGLYQINVGAR